MKNVEVSILRRLLELTFEREAEQLLRIAFSQTSGRVCRIGLAGRDFKRRNPDVNETDRKLSRYTVDLLPKAGGQALPG